MTVGIPCRGTGAIKRARQAMEMQIDIIKISQVSTEKIDYSTVIFKCELPKRVDVDNSKDLWIYFSSLIAGGALKIYLDLKKVEYIDSSGIGVIINATKMIRLKKGDIVIANISDSIKEIFRVISLENFIRTFNTEVEAINSFRYVT
jgi:anti-anti-sigma factor